MTRVHNAVQTARSKSSVFINLYGHVSRFNGLRKVHNLAAAQPPNSADQIEQSRRWIPENHLAMGAAVQYFLRATNITDARTYFADLAQGRLPFSNEEPTQ